MASEIQNYSHVKLEDVKWLWQDRLPLGYVSMIFGPPGLGKSQLSCLLAAEVSRGTIGGDPANVLMSTAEDGIQVMAARLRAAGARTRRIYYPENGEPLMIPDDIETLEDIVRRRKVRLVVLDPIMAHLGRGASATNDQSLRRALTPLKVIAERYQCAIVLLSHPIKNRSRATDPLQLIGGSVGMAGALRVALFFARHPDHTDKRVLAIAKNNLGPDDIESYVYDVETVSMRSATGRRIEVPRLRFAGTSEHSPATLMVQPPKATQRLGIARQFLLEQLAHGPKTADQLKRMSDYHEISWQTIRRAQKSLGIRPRQTEKNRWEWRLP